MTCEANRAFIFLFVTCPALVAGSGPAPASISFSQSAQTVEAYDFVEATLKIAAPEAKNPFTDVTVEGEFARQGSPPIAVAGFCDSDDGSIYRIRFAPSRPGEYTYSIIYREEDL